MLHDRSLQEASGSVVGGHDVGLPVPSQLLQSVATSTQPGFTVCHSVKAFAVCVEAVAKPPHLGHNDKVLPVEPAGTCWFGVQGLGGCCFQTNFEVQQHAVGSSKPVTSRIRRFMLSAGLCRGMGVDEGVGGWGRGEEGGQS